MCNFEKGFKLCTCQPKEVIHNKNSRRYKKIKKAQPKRYIWQLTQYKGPSGSHLIGLYELPSSKLEEGLSATFVAQNLNTKNCFDFEYQAAQGDCLTIYLEGSYLTFMSFIFRGKEWKIEHYDPFSTKMEDYKNGELKALEPR